MERSVSAPTIHSTLDESQSSLFSPSWRQSQSRPLSAPSSSCHPSVLMKSQKRIDRLIECGAHPSSWSSQDVGDWLVVIGMPQYRRQFISHGVDGEILLHINPELCIKLGVRNLGHQRWMLNKSTELKKLPFATRESIQEVLNKTTVPELLKRQQDLTNRKNVLKNMRELFDDVAKIAVFSRLQDCVKLLGIEGGEDLVTQARDVFRKLKATIPRFEQSASKMQESVYSDAMQLAHDLNCSCADLLMGDDNVPSPKKQVISDQELGCNVSNPSRRPLYTKAEEQMKLRRKQQMKEADEVEAAKRESDVWRWTQPNMKDVKLSQAQRQQLVDSFCERMSMDLQKRLQKIAEEREKLEGGKAMLEYDQI